MFRAHIIVKHVASFAALPAFEALIIDAAFWITTSLAKLIRPSSSNGEVVE